MCVRMAPVKSMSVNDMCSMLPYGTGIFCYACICIYFFIASVHSFFILKKNLVLIDQRKGPRFHPSLYMLL